MTSDDHRPIRLATGQVIRPRHLQGTLDRFGSAADGVDGRVVQRQVPANGSGVGLERLAGERRPVDVSEVARLLLGRINDRLAAVAHVDHDCPAGGIEVSPAVRVPDGAALGTDGPRQIAAEDPLEDPRGRPAGPSFSFGGAHARIVGGATQVTAGACSAQIRAVISDAGRSPCRR